MKKPIILLCLTGLFIGALVAHGRDRGLDDARLLEKLNGSPLALGWVYSRDGGSANNCGNVTFDAGTGGAFDAGLGDLLLVTCSLDTFVKPGNCATTASGTDLPILAGEKLYLMLKTDQMAVAFRPQDAGLSNGCGLWRME